MTRSWIHFTRGRFVRQARVGLGDLREEHLSRQGFAGPVAMLYRTDGPNEVVRLEGEYRPRQVDSADVVAPDAIRELWLQQFPKKRTALETPSSKSTKSVVSPSRVPSLRGSSAAMHADRRLSCASRRGD